MNKIGCVQHDCDECKKREVTPEQSSAVAQSLTERQIRPYAWHYTNNGGASVWHMGPSAKFDADLAVATEFPHAHRMVVVYAQSVIEQVIADMLEVDAKELQILQAEVELYRSGCDKREARLAEVKAELDKANQHIKHIGNDAMRSENARLRDELADLKSIADSDDGAGGEGMRLVLRNRELESKFAALNQQEPVAWRYKVWGHIYLETRQLDYSYRNPMTDGFIKGDPLYLAAGAQQVPLWLLKTTQDLAEHMAKKFYPEVPQFEVADTLPIVISQIDNMVTGLQRAAPQPPQGEVK